SPATNTTADAGTCPPAHPPPTPAQIDCFSEFLPNGTYQPTALHFRVTVRDGRGGVNGAPVTLTLAPSAGVRVTSPDTAVTWEGGSQQTVTWATGGTEAPPVNASEVKITLSEDGGHTQLPEPAESTANDATETVTLPLIETTHARIKVEAVGNVFFDLSNQYFKITRSSTLAS